MTSNYIPMLYEVSLPIHNELCVHCKWLRSKSMEIMNKCTNLAESGCGKGDIAHILLRGDHNLAQKLVLTIPYVIKYVFKLKFS